MNVIPAIDLRKGQVVRLIQGDFEKQKNYSDQPEHIAKLWEKDGAQMIHIVDLDGAQTGQRKNLEAVRRIAASIKTPIQLGGGMRKLEDIANAFQLGVSRIVLGTMATDIDFLQRCLVKWKDRVAVAVDVRDGLLQLHGWQQSSTIELSSFCRELEQAGVATIIYTDVTRDGMLAGPNMDILKHILCSFKFNVILSGGISTLEDLRKLRQIDNTKLVGVIIGKALYEKKFTLSDAIRELAAV